MKKFWRFARWPICVVILFFALTGGVMTYKWPFWGFPFLYEEVVDLFKGEAAVFVAKNELAKEFAFKDLNGAEFNLSSLKGKLVFLEFWSYF